jgi:thioredoxin 1
VKGTHRVLVVAALACVVGLVFMMKRTKPQPETVPATPPAQAAASVTNETTGAPKDKTLPRLVDLGASKCIPCKMMAPILEELSREYADAFEVEFIDVWENPKAGEEYGIRMIPTQIFYDATGKELSRHEGFFSKEDILARWKEYRVTVAGESVE